MPIEKLHPTFTFTEDRLAQLRTVVPEAFADGKINWETLRAALTEHLEPEEEGEEPVEHFGLFWPGKRAARRLAMTPSTGTLVPQPGLGVNEDTTRNLFIEGDNLEVLKLLLKSYAGRVKLIYIDPPYNTGNDFIYPDDYSEPLDAYLRRTGQMDEAGQLLTTNTKASGRFHSNWLNMMYPRLLMARQLLREDGAIFVSIDDNEVHNLRQVMNEVFGEENFVVQLVWKSRQFLDSRAVTHVSTDHEYIVVYSKQNEFSLKGIERDESKFKNPDNDPRGPWMSRSILGLATAEQRPNLHYDIVDPATGISYSPPINTGWRYSSERMQNLIQEGRILFPASPTGRPREKKFRAELQTEFISFPSVIDDVFTAHGTAEIRETFGFQAFDFPKPTELIRRLIEQQTADDDIVLDFFAGSGTTGHAVFLQNQEDNARRRFICVQFQERVSVESEAYRKGFVDIADIGRERIRRVIARMQAEDEGKLDLHPDEDLGFRSYSLTRSHFKPWQPYTGENVAELETLFTRFESPLIAGWQPDDLLAELLLLQGFPLDSHVVPLEAFTENRVLRVTSEACAHDLIVCLDARLHPATVAALDLRVDDVLVCLDSALTDEHKLRLADKGQVRVI